MGFFGNNNKGSAETKVVFDIGSGSVGCAVVSMTKAASKPYIHFIARTPISFQEEFNYDRLMRDMIAALNESGEQVQRFLSKNTHLRKLDEVTCTLSSLWYASKTFTLRREEKERFLVSSGVVEKMLNEQKNNPEQDEFEALERKHIVNPVIFERRVLNISLNGYATDNPLGQYASRVELSLFTAIMSLELYKVLQSSIEGMFEDIPISFHSHTLSLFTSSRDYLNASGGFVLVDVSGEMTDISVVEDGVLGSTTSIPTGAFTILRAIAERKGGVPQEAFSLVCMASGEGEQLNPASKECKITEEIGNSWLKDIRTAIKGMRNSPVSNRYVFLSAPADLGPWFKGLIELKNEDTEAKFDNTTPNVTLFSARLMHNFIDAEKNVAPDPIITTEILHVARL